MRLARVFLGSLARRQLATVFSVAAIVLGVALGMAVHTVNDSALSEFGRGLRSIVGEADLIVVYRVIMGHRVDANLNGWDRPEPFAPSRSDYSLRTSQKTQGTLVLDLIERHTGRLVYRATSEKDVSGKDVQPERLNSALKDMTKSLLSQ